VSKREQVLEKTIAQPIQRDGPVSILCHVSVMLPSSAASFWGVFCIFALFAL